MPVASTPKSLAVLSTPKLYTTAELTVNPDLSAQIIALASTAFNRSKTPWPDRWNFTGRFPTTQHLYDTLGPQGTLAVIIDHNAECLEKAGEENRVEKSGRAIACAALLPWSGGWAKEGATTEKGWEIKCVCVDGSEQYARTGLAVQLLSVLEKLAIEKETVQLHSQNDSSASWFTQDRKTDSASGCRVQTLRTWILVAECINGDYWKKRGYGEVRRKREGEGVWGSKTGFEMLVMAKDISWEDRDHLDVQDM
ncbi:hypothetical protein P154DRAFT_516781 [Amniculicola lignicola CBS 123094]|uniref:N-acetyltransferase domain-containing protein n=1 Tax=Amniculicola lignicola CBS 123094 TaxID=1392246 RepID=A0A6A5X518_9PLEO|nr:hypothetical protein P154DRAFT_516781 [Amniculicola lignicola CBS 123094]